MKFKAGDNFKVIENGLLGQIVGTSFNSVFQQQEYVVKWPHHSYEESYPIDECDSIWELENCPVVNTYLTKPKDEVSKTLILCTAYGHEWIDVGFQRTREVCKVCNTEKGNA
jgi:hypothetical protein